MNKNFRTVLFAFTAMFLNVIIFPLKYTGILWLLMIVTKKPEDLLKAVNKKNKALHRV